MDEMTSSFPIINNRYQIFSTVATGGMAVVYNAQDLILERRVALKILKKELSDDQAFQNKFRAEAKASAKLTHPNIVTTFDFGFDSDRLYIVMEYIDGTDLKTIIKNTPSMPFSQAMHFILQACSGLSYAHSSGFVHCDMKPQNLLVSKIGILKITDFGIARALDTISREEKYDVVWGSPFYFSPEQASGLAPSPATDIYSMGIIAYELLTGNLPFMSEDVAELAEWHRSKTPASLSSLKKEIPETLNQIILKCLSKKPEERYQTGKDLHNEILKFQSSIRQSYTVRKVDNQANSVVKKQPQKMKQKIMDSKLTLKKYNLITLVLSILALIMVGGLIPFYLFIIFSLNR